MTVMSADEKKKLEEKIEDEIEDQDEANYGFEETTDEIFEDVMGNEPDNVEGTTLADEVQKDEEKRGDYKDIDDSDL